MLWTERAGKNMVGGVEKDRWGFDTFGIYQHRTAQSNISSENFALVCFNKSLQCGARLCLQRLKLFAGALGVVFLEKVIIF